MSRYGGPYWNSVSCCGGYAPQGFLRRRKQTDEPLCSPSQTLPFPRCGHRFSRARTSRWICEAIQEALSWPPSYSLHPPESGFRPAAAHSHTFQNTSRPSVDAFVSLLTSERCLVCEVRVMKANHNKQGKPFPNQATQVGSLLVRLFSKVQVKLRRKAVQASHTLPWSLKHCV